MICEKNADCTHCLCYIYRWSLSARSSLWHPSTTLVCSSNSINEPPQCLPITISFPSQLMTQVMFYHCPMIECRDVPEPCGCHANPVLQQASQRPCSRYHLRPRPPHCHRLVARTHPPLHALLLRVILDSIHWRGQVGNSLLLHRVVVVVVDLIVLIVMLLGQECWHVMITMIKLLAVGG